MKQFSRFAWLIIPFTFAPLQYAHAYLDPGTGSYAIQVIIGLFFGGAYMLKSFGGKILEKLKLKKKPTKNE